MDIDRATQTIDEYKCKNSSGIDNQQFSIDSNAQTINAVQNASECLTMKDRGGINYNIFAYTYRNQNKESVSFLYNNDTKNDHNVLWQDSEYHLPSKSVSIVDNDGVELFNSAKVNSNELPTQHECITR